MKPNLREWLTMYQCVIRLIKVHFAPELKKKKKNLTK